MDTNQKIIFEFTNEIKRRCNERIKKIILFGSRARKDYREDSDFDFLIVVDDKDTSIREIISKILTQKFNSYISHHILLF